jgi:hypothetical protein
MPHVRRWQYDDNSGERSIDLFHVHIFIETIPFAFTARAEAEYFPPHVLPLPHNVSEEALVSDIVKEDGEAEEDVALSSVYE